MICSITIAQSNEIQILLYHIWFALAKKIDGQKVSDVAS